MLRLIARSSNRIFGSSKQSALNSTQRYYGNENRIHNAIRIEIFYFRKIFIATASPPKRFYKDTSILSCDGKFEITLDSKKLKTPSGAVFQVSNEPLAIAGRCNRMKRKWFLNRY